MGKNKQKQNLIPKKTFSSNKWINYATMADTLKHRGDTVIEIDIEKLNLFQTNGVFFR